MLNNSLWLLRTRNNFFEEDIGDSSTSALDNFGNKFYFLHVQIGSEWEQIQARSDQLVQAAGEVTADSPS